jgi:hypothetical protein
MAVSSIWSTSARNSNITPWSYYAPGDPRFQPDEP